MYFHLNLFPTPSPEISSGEKPNITDSSYFKLRN